jgi:hypothetical protein
MTTDDTDPSFSPFASASAAFSAKIARLRDVADFVAEQIDPVEQKAVLWRLAAALAEALEIGADLHRIICQMVPEIVVEIDL